MLWVDHESYFGPDRRRKPGGFRWQERREFDCAAPPPPLPQAMRALRMRVIEADGPGAKKFSDRAHNTALLAQMQDEPEAAHMLSHLATMAGGRGADMRTYLYEGLDRAQNVLRTLH